MARAAGVGPGGLTRALRSRPTAGGDALGQLDEQTVRRYAEDHGRAVVAGDVPHLLADLDASLHPGMGELAAALPQRRPVITEAVPV